MGPILGVLFASLFAMVGLGTLAGIQQRSVETQRAAVAADQLKLIASAAQTYVQAYGAAIEAVATASAPATITVPMLQATVGLSSGVSAINPYGQTWTVQVLQPTAGVLQTLVLSIGGTAIPTTQAPAIAAMAGGEGGFVPAAGQYGTLNSNVAEGAYGGWQVPLAGYTNPGPGHLAALVQYNNGNLTNDYLYRVAIPGQPQLNTMTTTLNMGGNSIAAANNIQAQTGTFAGGNGVQIGSSYYYGDTQNSAVRQNGSFFVQNLAGNAAPLDAGEVYSSDTVSAATTVSAGTNVSAGEAVSAGTQLEVAATASLGASCWPNGAIAASTSGTGQILDCVSGVWSSVASPPATVSLTFGGSGTFGPYYYCAAAGGQQPISGLYPSSSNPNGTFMWTLVGVSSAVRVNCF